MKITKFNQSNLLIETKGKRILIDPSNIEYKSEYVDEYWNNIDVILITHRHKDHCNIEVINKIIERNNVKIYTSNEVVKEYNLINANIVKENDVFYIDDIKVEVTKAVHGYLTYMRENKAEILENIGFIIDDGTTRLYTTSDTINFYNNYKCDILCMPFNGNGLTLGIVDGVSFAKAINPKLVLPIHLQHPKSIMNPNLNELKNALQEEGLNYKILGFNETLEV